MKPLFWLKIQNLEVDKDLMSKYKTFCDAYGTIVTQTECEKCKLRNDCIKIQLQNFIKRPSKIQKHP